MIGKQTVNNLNIIPIIIVFSNYWTVRFLVDKEHNNP